MNQPSSHESQFPTFELYSLSRLPELSASQPVSAEHFLQQGNQHYHHYLSRAIRRDLELAIVNFREALDLNPTLPEAHVKLASALLDKGAIPLEMALEYCDTSLRLNPHYGEAHLFKGYFLRKSGMLEQAIGQFRLALPKMDPALTAKARLALGQALIQSAAQNRPSAASQRLEIAGQGLLQLAWGCCLLPQDQKAFAVLRSALLADVQVFSLMGGARLCKTFGLSAAAEGIYAWGNRQLPQEPIFFHLLGDLHSGRDNLDGALYFYNRAQELDPDNPLLHKKLGQAYHESKDAANAAKSLEKVVDAEAADFDTLYTLGQIYSNAADYMRALYYFKELLNQAPENPYLHSNMAYVLFKMQDYDGAIQEYQQAVKFGKDAIWTATVAQTLGTIYYQVKQDLDAAARVFKLACQLDPDDLDCLSMLGDIYTDQGNFEAAIEAYEHILRVEPDNAECYNYLGYLLWQLDRNDEAVDAYQQAIALKLENPIAYNNLGVIYLDERCQLQQALDMFQQAIRLKPDYTLARFNVARTLEALGRTAEAAKGYTEALALNAASPELGDDEIRERLENLFRA